MADSPEISAANDRDAQLAALLEALSQRAAAGETVDIHAVAREHPDLADELVELWGAVMLANAIGSDASRWGEPTADVERVGA